MNIQMVYVLSNSSSFQPSVVELEQKYAEANFKKLVKEYGPRLGKDSRLRYIIKKGKVYREVVNQVNSYKNAVVSASTHGASGFEELFIGSNALKIIAATEKPVFTMRTMVPQDIRKIIVPIKLHLDTRQKAPMVADIAELFGAELHVLSISTRNNKRDLARIESYANQVEGYFTKRKLKSIRKSLVGDNLSTLTCNYCEAVDGDLIAIVSGDIDKWNVMLGSYAQQMVKSSPVPLLSITPQEKQIPAGFSTLG